MSEQQQPEQATGRVQMTQDDAERASVVEVVVGVTSVVGSIPGVVQVGKYVADQLSDKVGGTGGDHKAEKGDG